MKRFVVFAVMIAVAVVPAWADLINGGFETGVGSTGQYINIVGWSGGNGGTWGDIDLRDWRFHSGTQEGALHNWGAGQTDAGWWQQLTNSAAGTVWQASTWLWNDNGGSGGVYTNVTTELKIEFYSGTFGAPLATATKITTLPGESWQQVSVVGTSPVNTAWARFVLDSVGQGTGGALQLDDASLVVIPEPTVTALFGFAGLLFLAARRKLRK